jgi:hypothetical protein
VQDIPAKQVWPVPCATDVMRPRDVATWTTPAVMQTSCRMLDTRMQHLQDVLTHTHMQGHCAITAPPLAGFHVHVVLMITVGVY